MEEEKREIGDATRFGEAERVSCAIQWPSAPSPSFVYVVYIKVRVQHVCAWLRVNHHLGGYWPSLVMPIHCSECYEVKMYRVFTHTWRMSTVGSSNITHMQLSMVRTQALQWRICNAVLLSLYLIPLDFWERPIELMIILFSARIFIDVRECVAALVTSGPSDVRWGTFERCITESHNVLISLISHTMPSLYWGGMAISGMVCNDSLVIACIYELSLSLYRN